jgi:hypothetical protein
MLSPDWHERVDEPTNAQAPGLFWPFGKQRARVAGANALAIGRP